jgi:uncharacterized membrane protein
MDPNPPPFPYRRGFDLAPGHYHHGGAPALAWATFALVLLLALALVAFAAAGYGGRSRRRPGFFGPMRGGRPGDPLAVLRMRFASGQITRDEFLQATSDLTATAPTVEAPPPPPPSPT